jgi:hypothetical protein
MSDFSPEKKEYPMNIFTVVSLCWLDAKNEEIIHTPSLFYYVRLIRTGKAEKKGRKKYLMQFYFGKREYFKGDH